MYKRQIRWRYVEAPVASQVTSKMMPNVASTVMSAEISAAAAKVSERVAQAAETAARMARAAERAAAEASEVKRCVCFHAFVRSLVSLKLGRACRTACYYTRPAPTFDD